MMKKVRLSFVFAAELLRCLLRSIGAVAATGGRLEKQTRNKEQGTRNKEHGMFSWPVIPNTTALSFSGFKKAGPGFRCHAA